MDQGQETTQEERAAAVRAFLGNRAFRCHGHEVQYKLPDMDEDVSRAGKKGLEGHAENNS